ncbi:MAG: hypothetical protein JWQ89_2581 [Devosia sp.]|nr:hypothetical protein [Devosia sp.]
MSEISSGTLVRLAMWCKNMTAIKDGKMDWPGFSYSDSEWERMYALAAPVTYGTYQKYVWINAVIFIVIAAIGIAVIFMPAAIFLFPVPAETSALKFSLLLAGCAFLILGGGLPISLRIASWLAVDAATRAQLAAAPGDAALDSKVSWQINRITLIMCGILVPGMLVWITYDINAGPIVTVIKWVAIGLMGVSTAAGVQKQRKQK